MGWLIVIDMQPQDKLAGAARDERTILSVEREILRAIALDWGILVVEMHQLTWGPTDQRLTRHLDLSSGRHFVVEKHSKDGSQELLQFKRTRTHLGISWENVRVCGVNIESCVAATVRGLSRSFLHLGEATIIHVIQDACNTWTCGSDSPWDFFPRAENIVLENG